MASRIGGQRRKSRYKLTKDINKKGKISITKYMQKFSEGDKVYLDMEPAVQKGAYHAKYKGKIGIVKNKSGECYGVNIKDGDKEKTLIVHPVHLTKA